MDSLSSALSVADPRKFQLYHRGQQIDIKVVGESDGSFDTGDEIHFYGAENDGVLDSLLYKPMVRPHPYLSLYSNETAFFLTAGNTNGNRIEEIPYQTNSEKADSVYNEELLRVFADDYIFNPASVAANPYLSKYQPIETVVSTNYYKNIPGFPTPPPARPYTETISLPNYLAGTAVDLKIEVMLANKANFQSSYSYNFDNGLVGTFNLPILNPNELSSSSILKKQINTPATNTINLNISSTSNNNFDYFCIFYRKINYPASFTNTFNRLYKLYPKSTSNISIVKFADQANNMVFDVTDFNHVKKQIFELDGTDQKYSISGTNNEKNIWVANVFKRPKKLTNVVFENINQNEYDYLMVTDSRTIASANRYKEYRETNMGGNYKVYIAETQKLYDQFAYGERTPMALKRFVAYMAAQKTVKNLFLMGQSVSFPSRLKRKEIANQPDDEFVPTFGYPGSDIHFSSELNGFGEFSPSIPTGRLVVNSDSEIDQYLAKVKLHDARLSSVWQENILPITGGRDAGEYTRFNTIMNDGLNFAINSGKNINAYPIMAYNSPNGMYPNIGISDPSLYTNINNGVGILTFFGHGYTTGTQYNFGLVSATTNTGGVIVGGPINYQNMGKSPLIIAMSCDLSDSFKGTSLNKTNATMMTDWVNHPTLGAINAISHTNLGWENSSGFFFKDIFSTLFENDNNYFGTVGELLKKANLKFSGNANISDLSFRQVQEQTNLLGDPANKIFYQKCDSFAGATIESNTTGAWNNSNTWTCGVEPSSFEPVKIMPGHIVHLPSGITGFGNSIIIEGKVIVESSAELKLENAN